MGRIRMLFYPLLRMIIRCFFPVVFILAALPWVNQAANDNIYRIGEEDILILTIIAGGEIQCEVELVVSEQGELNAPFIGRIEASGQTLSQLETSIREPLAADYFVDPEVHLRIKEYHSLQYFISGAVRSPGMYKLGFNPSVMDLLARAGGTISGRGNVAYILKKSEMDIVPSENAAEAFLPPRKTRMVDLIKLLDEGDMSENVLLESGDTVYVPLSTQLNQNQTKIYVEGEVRYPGIFDYQPGLTAMAACIMAGGFDKFAAPERTRIIRITEAGQEIIRINLDQVKKGEIADLSLKPGDRIHIPESWL